MENKRIISIFLFLLVIVINLFFSLYFQPYREGFSFKKRKNIIPQNSQYFRGIEKVSDIYVKNISNDDVRNMDIILNDNTLNNYQKIDKIYKNYVKNNKILFTMYDPIVYNCISDVKKYMKDWPILDKNGNNVDEKAITQSTKEFIETIFSNNPNENNYEKFSKIKLYVCNGNNCDRTLLNIYTNYEKIFIDILTSYVKFLSSSKNYEIAANYGQIP
jgi:hypothetical protein